MKLLTKIIALAIPCVMAGSLLTINSNDALAYGPGYESNPSYPVRINYDHFGSTEFADYIKEYYDGNDNGYLEEDEAELVKFISCSGRNISYIDGLQYFRNLRLLDCSNNKLSTLKLNTISSHIKAIDCSNNELTNVEIDFDYCDNLAYFNAANNKLSGVSSLGFTEYEISTPTYGQPSYSSYYSKLPYLNVSGNKFSRFNAARFPNLRVLYICNNKDYSLQIDVSNNESLRWLNCYNSNVVSINTQSQYYPQYELEHINCANNRLDNLNLEQLTNLKSLDCSNNELTSLNLSGNANLTRLICQGNPMTSLDLSGNSALSYAYLNYSRRAVNDSYGYSSEDFYSWDSIRTPYIEYKNTSGYSYSNQNTPFLRLPLVNYGSTINIQANSGSYYPPYDYSGSYSSNISLTGASNNGEYPDYRFAEYLSNNYDLNQDGYLDRTEQEFCGYINCSGMEIESINILNNLEYIYFLDCSNNRLSSIGINSYNGSTIEYLNCSNNNISCIDLHSLQNLEYLDCYNNSISSFTMPSGDGYSSYSIDNDSIEYLRCSRNSLNNFYVHDLDNLKYLDISENYPTGSYYGVNSLDVRDNSNLKWVRCNNSYLGELRTSVDSYYYNPQSSNIKYLDCSHNNLSELDLSNLNVLENLNCSYNSMLDLDIFENSKLTTLKCYGNGITCLVVKDNEYFAHAVEQGGERFLPPPYNNGSAMRYSVVSHDPYAPMDEYIALLEVDEHTSILGKSDWDFELEDTNNDGIKETMRVFAVDGENANVDLPSFRADVGDRADTYYYDYDWPESFKKNIEFVCFEPGIRSVGSGFCSQLSNLYCVDLSHVSAVGDYAFLYCTNLEELRFPDTCTDVGAAVFVGCSSLRRVIVFNEQVGGNSLNPLFCDNLECIFVPCTISDSALETASSVIELAEMDTQILHFHYTCADGLKDGDVCPSCGDSIEDDEVVIPRDHSFENVDKVESTCTTTGTQAGTRCSVCGYVAAGCGEIAMVDHTPVVDEAIPATCTTDGKTEGSHCGVCNEVLVKQRTITAGHNYVTTDEGCYCTKCEQPRPLDAIVHPMSETVTCTIIDSDNNGIYDQAIYSGEGEIPDYANDLIPEDERDLITSVVIEDGITSIGKYAFRETNSLKTVTISEDVTSIGTAAFVDCHELTTINIPSGVTAIAPGMLHRCYKLEAITIPDGVTSIGEGAFYNCNTLTSITIPSSVTFIDENAFDECENLTAIIVNCDNYDLVKDNLPDGLGVLTHEGHEIENIASVEATCMATGMTAGSKCSGCGAVISGFEVIDKLNHVIVVDPAVAATCTTDGKTEGKHCSECGTVFIQQEIIPAGHHSQVVEEVPATCTSVGKAAGTQCSVCGEILSGGEEIAMLEHTVVVDAAVAPTCTTAGKMEGSHCSVCGEVIIKQDPIPAAHTPEDIAEVPATCTSIGTTAGTKCSICGEILSGYKDIPMTEHTDVVDAAVEPTCSSYGKTEGSHCSVCDEVIEEPKIIPTLDHTYVADHEVAATCTAPGLSMGIHCSVCSKVLLAQETIPAKGHTAVVDRAVAATVNSTGLTAGSHCSVCGTVLVAQQVVPKLTPVVTPDPAPVNPAPTPIPVPTQPEEDDSGAAGFVERLYTVALGRASDPNGKAAWISALRKGATGAEAAQGFLFSAEFLNKDMSNEQFVSTLYKTFFDREPDQGGLNAWVGAIENGETKSNVIMGFINSTEWANVCLKYGIASGGTGTPNIEVEPNEQIIAFATRLYTTCLKRTPDQNGLMAWARQLANLKDTGSNAAHGFFFSDEMNNNPVSNEEFVTRLYLTFMDRQPDAAGMNAWVGQLDAGVSREEVFQGFAQSSEFGAICANYGIIR